MAISVENAKFSHPRVFCAPDEGVPLELGIGAGVKKTRMMELPGRERSFTTSSTIWIQCTNVTDGLADGQTDTRRQQRPLLRIASRGEMQRKRRRRRRVRPTAGRRYRSATYNQNISCCVSTTRINASTHRAAHTSRCHS